MGREPSCRLTVTSPLNGGRELASPLGEVAEGRKGVELKIQRSRFIGRIEPCSTEQEAKDILKRVRAEHNNATHHCWAYVIALNNYKIEHCSDNGEPPGTAGRPILGAIKRSGLVNVMLIVTRYFGGKKLGVRGLIDAYGLTAEKTLELAKTKN